MYRNSSSSAKNTAVCKFYQQGKCRFGDNCRFQHPGSHGSGAGGQQDSVNTNSFARLGQPQRPSPSPAFGQAAGSGIGARPSFSVTKEDIQKDLGPEKPQWPFSCYAPGRDAPRQLFEGAPVEQSMEEMRLHYYTAQAAGNDQSAVGSNAHRSDRRFPDCRPDSK